MLTSLSTLAGAAIAFGPVEAARGQSAQTGYHYHYFKQQRKLPLDVDRIAIFRNQLEGEDPPVNGLPQYGIKRQDAERRAVSGWWTVAVPPSSRHPEGIENLLAAVTRAGGKRIREIIADVLS